MIKSGREREHGVHPMLLVIQELGVTILLSIPLIAVSFCGILAICQAHNTLCVFTHLIPMAL